MRLRVVVPPHPLIAHWLTMLRTAATPPPLYAKSLEELGRWLTYEALRDWLPNRNEQIETPETKTIGTVVDYNIPLLAIPSLPGGLELWNGGKHSLPNATLCIGGVPSSIKENEGIIIFLDQIDTGENLLKTLLTLKRHSVETKRIRVICALASNQGLKKIGENFHDLTIYCACIDAETTATGEISPGIGNPTLRLNARTAGPD